MQRHLLNEFPGRFLPSMWRVTLLTMLVAASLAWAQGLDEVLALREQARAAYPVGFVDRDLWKLTIEAAQGLVLANPEDLEVRRLMAEIYTETQWWILAWEAWLIYRRLGGAWDEAAQAQAALSARALAFYASQRGDLLEAEFWQRQATEMGG